MIEARDYRIILVTAPDMETGRKLAAHLLQQHAVACVNLVPGLESHYWWENKLESEPEVLCLIKTRSDKVSAVEDAILKHHPYDTPEFLVLPIESGAPGYLQWISQCLDSEIS